VSRAKKNKVDIDDVVARLDGVLLIVQGAARLAWAGEDAASRRALIVEVAAILDVAAEKLNGLSRELAGSKDV
jgi:hypothetical protein